VVAVGWGLVLGCPGAGGRERGRVLWGVRRLSQGGERRSSGGPGRQECVFVGGGAAGGEGRRVEPAVVVWGAGVGGVWGLVLGARIPRPGVPVRRPPFDVGCLGCSRCHE
jgi:hypothetical protein